MAHIASQSFLPLALLAALCASGCVYRNGVTNCRFWADYNTLMAPAVFFEETEHLPYRAPRVEYFRWMYNADTVAQRLDGNYGAAVLLPAPVDVQGVEQAVPLPHAPAPETSEPPGTQLPPLPSILPPPRSMNQRPAMVIPRPTPRPPAGIRFPTDGPTAATVAPLRL